MAEKRKRITEANQNPLTARETEILMLASEGLKTKIIAQTLFISPATVETHKINIYRKLDTDNITEAVAISLRHKWIE